MSDRRTLQLAHRGGQRGQALVEFALVLPLLLIVLFIAVDFGVGLTRWIAITNAAREGARLGAVGADEAAIRLKESSGRRPSMRPTEFSPMLTSWWAFPMPTPTATSTAATRWWWT
jgi:Flp pilus assembly protein TadG